MKHSENQVGPLQAMKKWAATHPQLFRRRVANHPGPDTHRAAPAALKPLETIWHRLSLRGWNTITVMGATCAEKEFQTAVGPKFAQAYIEGQMIRGVYESEGRNVLAHHCKLLTPDWQSGLTDKDLDAIDWFCKYADRAIGDSYAVRLRH